ncbi:MAG TPA: hypothetical protein VFA54_07595 [Bryobacterales bacterium]|jgi:hypothetical protein|nr:hypothetical protein [Bryobacterales bacterium]
MSRSKIFVSCLALLLFVFLPITRADEWNKKTIITFDKPVEVPGMVLPAGTYVFRLADSQSDRHIVQILNKDENHVYATILAIPDYRLQPTGQTVVQFEERAANAPQAIQAWFYPGDNYGDEFVYPEVRARQIAQASSQPVLATKAPPQTPSEMKTAPVETVRPETPQKQTEVAQAAPPPAPPQQTEQQPAAAPAQPAQPLPKTASPLPLIGLLGLSSLGIGGVLRAMAKRSA